MANDMKFLPKRKADVVAYAGQLHSTLTATGFVPASVGLTPQDVTDLGTLYTGAQTTLTASNAAKVDKQSKTQAFSAPGGAFDRLAAKLRAIASAARISDASDDAVAALGVSRRDPKPTPKSVPLAAPEFSLDAAKPGFLRVRFRETGSARPRARAANTTGIQVAVVDAVKAEADGEADMVPYVILSRSPATMDSTQMPGEVRLYARWVGSRGQVGAWSSSLGVTVP